MASIRTDHDWEYFAQTDPYWAVVTADHFRNESLDADARQAFFASGQAYVDFLFQTIGQHIRHDFAPCHGLDFGCGVGRVLMPLARRCRRVVGIDVAPTMLAEARQQCQQAHLDNVTLLPGDDELADCPPRFDFIHSYIVFQHIPCDRGVQLFRNLLGRLDEGGIRAFHFTFAERPRSSNRFLNRCYRWARAGYRSVRGIGQRLGLCKPTMQMNPYDLSLLLITLQTAGVRRLHLEFTDHGGIYGALLFFEKRTTDSYRA